MEITQNDLDGFYKAVDILDSNLEPTEASVLLKVFYYYMKKASSTSSFHLPQSILERLEQSNYSEDDPEIYEELSRIWRIIAAIAQE
ncbi:MULTISPECIES: hypothetical protein [unclassified Paenibacillus]|uniref:hypothetical protein n=1 Tax=unclassified Paenibacillus TaxID=185978 RepID=UPI001AE83578|nr:MULTISPECIES: hypothetical protein [unclassified Paenibacillus]MBP1153929.1 hypothetical protein [Paenibacillus sp. PvP091]MBP1170686.1 hypothetical protein [Paenibacillus sp. PvR098]MBP2441714.1 hypothetical protein [Paenibacillus sp. PvP052]